ncbi:MAG: hypothetical protein IKB82_07585 [Clostridia bacterium]|nr:hypothetical protein [Clostridia bacterium]
MSAARRDKRHIIGMALVLLGTLLVFICLPMQVFIIALGALLAATGLILLR